MSTWKGNKLTLSIFGQSHSAQIGMRLDGIPAGEQIDLSEVDSLLARRRASASSYSTPRREADVPVFTEGVELQKSNGNQIVAIIENTNVSSKDYEKTKSLMRPSHADYSAWSKFGDKYDYRGGGQFSGRMTAPMCIAGGIAMGILKKSGVSITAYVSNVGQFSFGSYDNPNFTLPDGKDAFLLLSQEQRKQLDDYFLRLRADGDSVGGVIECIVTGLPAGVGDAMFDSLESKISSLAFGVPAVKSIEFGLGKDISAMLGSQANDQFYYDEDKVKTRTNNNGGINGGISNGMPITFRVAIKPTPSILKEQNTVDIGKRQDAKIKIEGRHDVCIVPRAVPVIESIAAIAILDSVLQ